MDNNGNIFYADHALEINQPFGTFYVFKIPASKLIEVAFSMAAYSQNGRLSGVQRKLKEERIKQISLFSSSDSATFPNTIILSANFNPEGQFIEDEKITWKVNGDEIVIPTSKRLASIIDGQHRLEGIKRAIKDNPDVDFDVLCAVFIDLPFPQQAEIFTSINYNQRKVDKSVAYELFGYDLDDTNVENWSPDTLAIYFARILNNDPESPLKGHIYSSLKGSVKNETWSISTACVVESICILITNNATVDRYTIHQTKSSFFDKKGRERVTNVKSTAPLRELYINRKDKDIFEIVFQFLKKVESLGWFSDKNLVTTKTIGFIAMFEILKEALKEQKELSEFLTSLDNVSLRDLKKESFNFSGIGTAQVKEVIRQALNFKSA
ncbi:DGQHR domain-containing protein [Idiomarina sp.]|uniref:DGQHR domain-containing protein n=1 Tax=Idiomarina sp. TaxID=1874361 RepID=UPI0025BA60E0|nr:DGQHR domain-containing protein [Idiomarina sp.]